jgi:2-hydroxy-3-keto-5-methylthiopentenyl-1-phosphate phosphatase
MPNIAIVWDFDGTLTPDDSTTKAVEILDGDGKGEEFWRYVKSFYKDKKTPTWEHILAADAPIWMYSLSRVASRLKIPLNKEFFKEFFKEFVAPNIELYSNVLPFLETLKEISSEQHFTDINLKIHHFIVTAGLKELVEQVFPVDLITWTFGCRYEVVVNEEHQDEPESVPVFCMDETMKTRSLFEISKGVFQDKKIKVNTRVEDQKLWTPFKNILYVGDGDTDVPALSLVRDRGGLGIAVFNPKKKKKIFKSACKVCALIKEQT